MSTSVPLSVVFMACWGYLVFYLFGWLNDFLMSLSILSSPRSAQEPRRQGYVPLYRSFGSFYERHAYRRIRDAFAQPISSLPGPLTTLLARVTPDHNWTFQLTGTSTQAINLGSYNYLGFAQLDSPSTPRVQKSIRVYGVGVASTRLELGTLAAHRDLERLMARFLGVEDALVFGMGFATNSTNIPVLADVGTLILSDAFNHSSICLGCKLSGATIRVFKHNDMRDLEKKLREAILEGQPKSGKPWRKIIIFVEGVYSMEGTIVDLPRLILLKKKYKTYIYLDEAHSIGALGQRGRGVTDFFNCDPRDVDLLMGTFTKSFSAAGGYIAGTKKIIDHIRRESHSFIYGTSMSPPIIEQIKSVLEVLMDDDEDGEGYGRRRTLARNTRYFRRRLEQMNFIVYGHEQSPVVPVIMYYPNLIVAYIREAKKRNIAVVGASVPAVSMFESRIRFCMSAGHTKEMLDEVLDFTLEFAEKFWVPRCDNEMDPDTVIEY